MRHSVCPLVLVRLAASLMLRFIDIKKVQLDDNLMISTRTCLCTSLIPILGFYCGYIGAIFGFYCGSIGVILGFY